jgi:hypothetical protein
LGGALKKKVTTIAPAHARKPRIVHSDDLVSTILDRVAMGEPLSKVCGSANMPTRKSFFDWVAKDEEIRVKYEFAMQMRADLYADETITIADETSVEARHDGEDVTLDLSTTAVARNRLRVDARKWYASKLAPKKYGDKTTTELTGANGGPVQQSIAVSFVVPK